MVEGGKSALACFAVVVATAIALTAGGCDKANNDKAREALTAKMSLSSPIRPAAQLPIPFQTAPMRGDSAAVPAKAVTFDLCGESSLDLSTPEGDAAAKRFAAGVWAAHDGVTGEFNKHALGDASALAGENLSLAAFLAHFSAMVSDLRGAQTQLEGSADAQAKAVVLVGANAKARLALAVAAAPTPTAYGLLWGLCSRELGNPHESELCSQQNYSAWAKAAPNDAAPWLALLDTMLERTPSQDPWPTMQRIAQASKWERLPKQAVLAVWQAMPQTINPTQRYALQVLLMQNLQLYPGANTQRAYQLCKEPGALQAEQRRVCNALAEKLVLADAGVGEFMAGKSLGLHLNWSRDRLNGLDAQLQKLNDVPQSILGAGQAFSCQAVRRGPSYFQSMVEQGEMAYLRSQITP